MNNNFDKMYDDLTTVYVELESMMGNLYQGIQQDPTDQRSVELLQGLGRVAMKVICSQKDLVVNYGDKDMKEVLISNLESKEVTLSNSLSQETSKKM
ncbi:MAG: hypothetical protein RSA10_03375 [Bacilli bacterium]